MENTRCTTCNCECKAQGYTTGYGTMDKKPYCFECIGKMDREGMEQSNLYTLYLLGDRVANWPDTFSIPCRVVETRHNFGYKAKHVWVKFDNSMWYGKNCSRDSQLINLRRCKGV